MLLMDWKRDSTAESLVMLRPRMWLLFMRLTNVVTAFCRAFRNCSWFSSDSPFWYCCWGDRVTGQGHPELRASSSPAELCLSGAAQPCRLQDRPRPPLTSTTPSGVG